MKTPLTRTRPPVQELVVVVVVVVRWRDEVGWPDLARRREANGLGLLEGEGGPSARRSPAQPSQPSSSATDSGLACASRGRGVGEDGLPFGGPCR